MVLADRTPPGSQRSTWVERGHARRLGRRESASAYWFCPSCGRALYAIKKASGFPHGSSVDSCGNRSVFGWLCRTRLGEVQNRPSATSPIPKVLQCGSAELEMASPKCKPKYCAFSDPQNPPNEARTFLSAFCFSRDAARKWLLATPAGASAADLQAPRASWCSVDDREYTYGFVSSRRIR